MLNKCPQCWPAPRYPHGSWVWLVGVEKAHSTVLSARSGQGLVSIRGRSVSSADDYKTGDAVRKETSKEHKRGKGFTLAFRSNLPW